MNWDELNAAMMRDIQLHEQIEIIYVAGGWAVRFSPDDGNSWSEFEGETPMDALKACFSETRNHRGRSK